MKFSIVIPVYNVENYLFECIAGILKQTFSDYEVILIDDGSTDSSREICEQYSREYKNFHIIHQKNQGQSIARNKGIEISIGEYILFLDSDDYYLESDLLQSLANEARGCDIVAFNWKKIQESRKSGKDLTDAMMPHLKSKYRCGKEYLEDALNQRALYPWYPCIYAIRREYWLNANYHFVEGIKYEDVELIYKVLFHASEVRVVSDKHYIYRYNRPDSTVSTAKLAHSLDMLSVIEKNITEVLNNDIISQKLKKMLNNNFSCMYYSAIIDATKLSVSDRNILLDELRKRKWICQYTTSCRQKIVKNLMNILSLRAICLLLGIRRRIKYMGA